MPTYDTAYGGLDFNCAEVRLCRLSSIPLISELELTDLILSLARAHRAHDLPVTHILLTSYSESDICKVFQNEEVRPLVREIPVQTSRESVSTIISLDGADVDNGIYMFFAASILRAAMPPCQFLAASEGSTRTAGDPRRQTFHWEA
jgi:hypothetical protein